jgi:hypothetical protein
MDIVREFEDGIEVRDTDGEVAKEYWRESQPALGNALALVQQSQEMALKGKIAAVSPFLLIGNDPRDWPRGCDKEDTEFSSFRTIDAADLIKVHNTVCAASERLSDEFRAFYNEVRRQRNAIIHAGGVRRKVEVAELFLNILQTNEYLYPDVRWFPLRRQYAHNDRTAVAFSTDTTVYYLMREFEAVVNLLKPAQAQRFLGLTKARRYLCPSCAQDTSWLCDDLVPTAQLMPNTSTAMAVHCLLCGEIADVTRVKCVKGSCKSNVICADHDWGAICLICWEGQA